MNFNPLTWDSPFPIIVIALYCIVFFRAFGTYWLGRGIAAGTERTRFSKLMQSAQYLKAVNLINKYGPPAIALCFLTIGFQTVMNLAAGAMRMKLNRYLPGLLIGCLFWALIYASLGYVSFTAIGKIWKHSPTLAIGLAIILISALSYYIYRILNPRDSETGISDTSAKGKPKKSPKENSTAI